MADGIFYEVRDFRINHGALGRFLTDPSGQVGVRAKAITDNLTGDIQSHANIETGSMKAGVQTSNATVSGSGQAAQISFLIDISALRGAKEVGSAESQKRLDRGVEYAKYVNDRYHFVEKGIKTAKARNG